MPPLRDILRYSLIILVVMVPFLFSPQPAPDQKFCGTFYHIGSYAGFVVNCDSYEYARVSVHPSCLFEPHSIRQSRPLFILAGSAVGYLLYPLLSLFYLNIWEAHFAGFLLINLILILISLFLLDKLLLRFTSLSVLERSLIGILLLSNVVTKTFLWTAHQQMFIFLTPLLCIYAVLWFKGRPSQISIWVVSLLIGFSMLVYGNFVLLVISFCMALLWYKYDMRTMLMSIALILGPSLIWILVLRLNDVAYYNHEIAHYRQFVWVVDTLQVSWSALIHQAHDYWNSFMSAFHSILILVFLLIVATIGYGFHMPRMEIDRTLLISCMCVILLEVIFMYFMGLYEERLTFTLAAPLLILFAVFYDRGVKLLWRYADIMLLIVTICWHYFNATRYGPFS